MNEYFILSLLIVGIVQSVGYFIRLTSIKDHDLPYSIALTKHWYLYTGFFIFLGALQKLTSIGLMKESVEIFIMVAGPLMALRYMHIVYGLPRRHNDYI